MCCIGNVHTTASPLKANSKMNATIICGKTSNLIFGDTVTLVLNGPFYSYQSSPERYATQILTTTTDGQGNFKFKIETEDSPFHVSLYLSSKRDILGHLIGNGDLAYYLVSPTDSIHVDFTTPERKFTGKGASLFEAQYQIEQSDKGQILLKKNEHDYLNTMPRKWLEQKDSLLNDQLNSLLSFQSKLTPTEYSIIRADLIGSNRVFVCQLIRYSLPQNQNNLNLELRGLIAELKNRQPYIQLSNNAALAPKYVFYLYEKLKLEMQADLSIGEVPSDRSYFEKINADFNGNLKDKLLAWWLMDLASMNALKSEYAELALSVMHNAAFIKLVKNLEETFTQTQKVTGFEFKNTNNQTVRLTDFKGKVIVLDMWFTGCTGCKRVAAGLPNVEKAFTNNGKVVFISLSIDKDRQRWLNSIDSKHGKYFITSTTQYLYTCGTGEKNDFIKKYVPNGAYPSMMIINGKGELFSTTPTHPIDNESQAMLIKEIKSALTEN